MAMPRIAVMFPTDEGLDWAEVNIACAATGALLNVPRNLNIADGFSLDSLRELHVISTWEITIR